MREREPGRYEITHAPASVRARDRQTGIGPPVLKQYERVTFEKELVSLHGRPQAEIVRHLFLLRGERSVPGAPTREELEALIPFGS